MVKKGLFVAENIKYSKVENILENLVLLRMGEREFLTWNSLVLWYFDEKHS